MEKREDLRVGLFGFKISEKRFLVLFAKIYPLKLERDWNASGT